MLSAEIVQQVRRLQLTCGRDVSDVLAGAYHSVFKGRGMEFDEVRPYVPGDDVRTIDWNVTARTGETFVKRFVEERELTVMLLVDISPSQNFGSAERSKREAAVELSAMLAFSAISNQDKVGLLLFHGATEEYIPPRSGQKHALRVVREVLARGQDESPTALRPGNPLGLPRAVLRRFRQLVSKRSNPRDRATNISHALEFCRRVLPRKVVLFLISDFIDDDYIDMLRHANQRHDVICALVNDARELAMPPAGLITLEDAETGELRCVDTRSSAFRASVAEHSSSRIDALQSSLRASRVDLLQIDAARPVIDPLLQFFRMRERRQRR
jgi:uncharacterized protein (DUF58 family)